MGEGLELWECQREPVTKKVAPRVVVSPNFCRAFIYFGLVCNLKRNARVPAVLLVCFLPLRLLHSRVAFERPGRGGGADIDVV